MNAVEIVLLIGLQVVFAWGIVKARAKRRIKREAAQHQQQGAENAEKAAVEADEYCVSCSHKVDPNRDIYDKKHKHWWCRKCWSDLSA